MTRGRESLHPQPCQNQAEPLCSWRTAQDLSHRDWDRTLSQRLVPEQHLRWAACQGLTSILRKQFIRLRGDYQRAHTSRWNQPHLLQGEDKNPGRQSWPPRRMCLWTHRCCWEWDSLVQRYPRAETQSSKESIIQGHLSQWRTAHKYHKYIEPTPSHIQKDTKSHQV